jgi:hypothetical protein
MGPVQRARGLHFVTPQQLDRALAGLAPPLRRALLAQLQAWAAQGRRVALRDVEAAIASGNPREVVRAVLGDSVADVVVIVAPALPDAARAFDAIASPAAISAATRTEQALVRAAAEAVARAGALANAALPPRPPGVRVPFTGGADSPLSGILTLEQTTTALPMGQRAAVRYAGDALQYLRLTTHQGIIAAVADGNAAGVNPRDIARGLRDVVGLGDSQAVWVSNLRRELEAGRFGVALDRKLLTGPIRQTVAARARSGKALSPSEVDRIVAGYADKWRAWHAETISRTTSLDLLRHGSLAKAKAAVARGEYGNEPVTKRWVTRIDGRQRDSHELLNGKVLPLDGVWWDDGVPRQTAGGYNCRCAVVFRVGL